MRNKPASMLWPIQSTKKRSPCLARKSLDMLTLSVDRRVQRRNYPARHCCQNIIYIYISYIRTVVSMCGEPVIKALKILKRTHARVTRLEHHRGHPWQSGQNRGRRARRESRTLRQVPLITRYREKGLIFLFEFTSYQ